MGAMIDRVAQALLAFETSASEFKSEDCGWHSLLNESGRNFWRAKARAAIEAMREPTDEQRNAYYELSHRTEVMFDAHWERAIDAALVSEQPKADV
ncbi:hypothetical protein V1290_000074 [Bradyrhizobium sp. AZCC 1578]|uniref:hypothetical protein n=1 Tax=Bradyrhizobium sp. AZCC 1578 TaxID=3117027 RepID=UPI002FF1B028